MLEHPAVLDTKLRRLMMESRQILGVGDEHASGANQVLETPCVLGCSRRWSGAGVLR